MADFISNHDKGMVFSTTKSDFTGHSPYDRNKILNYAKKKFS